MKILVTNCKHTNDVKFKEMLAATGENVSLTYFNSPSQAIRILTADLYIDLLIIGPEEVGNTDPDLLNFLKTSARMCWIPIIVLGDAIDDMFVQQCLDGGVSDIISLPIIKEAFVARVQMAICNGRRKVLVIDDDEPILQVLKSFFEIERFVVVTAKSAEEALKILSQQKIHAVVTDILLPGMNGFELLVKVKEKNPRMPVILITGHSGNYTPQDAIAAGADGYFAKPFKNMELNYVLRRIFGLRFLHKLEYPCDSPMVDCK
jgi:CheY-like chemotaxis protein